MALDDDDIPLLTHRLSEGMASSYYSQRCTGNSVAFAQITYARCFFIFQVASTAVVIVFASWFLLCDLLATVATFYSVVVQCLFFALILVTYCIILPFC